MRISEVAELCGVAASALRFYEAEGLIEPGREANGYRSYDGGVIERLSLIGSAKHLGLPLEEIGELLEATDRGTCTQVRESLRPRLEQRLAALDRRLRDLQQLRARLSAAVIDMAQCPDSAESRRIECMGRGAPKRGDVAGGPRRVGEGGTEVGL